MSASTSASAVEIPLAPGVPVVGNALQLASDVAGFLIEPYKRLAEYCPDPGRFDIDRDTAERNEHRRPGVYAPFGMGPHT